MRKLSYIRITLLIICCLFTTHFCFAQLAVDDHIPEELTYSETIHVERNIWKEIEVPAAMVSVSIDAFTYDPSANGVATLDGSFYIHNYHPRYSLGYSGEIHLEIFKKIGEDSYLTLLPHAEKEVSGTLKSWNENRDDSEIIDDFSESLNLNIDCLKGVEEVNVDDVLTAFASIKLEAKIRGTRETWINDPVYKEDFIHRPIINHGLGPTATEDGDTFSNDCSSNGGDLWYSLMITDAPYSQIYWYVKGPKDTSALGNLEDTVDGDGAERNSVYAHPFPKQDGLPGTGSFYTITAYVYRIDLSVYWKSYTVWVEDSR